MVFAVKHDALSPIFPLGKFVATRPAAMRNLLATYQDYKLIQLYYW